MQIDNKTHQPFSFNLKASNFYAILCNLKNKKLEYSSLLIFFMMQRYKLTDFLEIWGLSDGIG